MQAFDIYFRGEALPDADPTAVRAGVARLFRIEESAVDRLFSGQPLRVKRDVDADTASRYRAAFREVGALVQIVPAGAEAPAATSPETATPSAAARRQASADAGPALAEPGAIIDRTPPPPPANIDTSGLEALPPNTGTLEDCREEKPPHPIPDISHLRITED
jgi:hypothetical protein